MAENTKKAKNRLVKKLQEKRIEFINRKENSIVILFSRLPLILNEERFNNFEYGFHEGKMKNFFQNDKNSLKDNNRKDSRVDNNVLDFIILFNTEKVKNLRVFTYDARVELKKVVWSTKAEVIQTTLIVFVVVILMSILLWLLDKLLGAGIKFLLA